MTTTYKGIYLDAPSVGRLEKEYLNEAIDSGYVSTAGPLVPEFEKRFAKYVGAKKAVSTQSGTAAIHMALHELGIGRGAEVIVPALTFVATVNPIMYVGAKPVFADVDIATWNIRPDEVERNITKRTKAVIPVHFYGNPCDMDAILRIARRRRLHVIEDATESLGAIWKGKHSGTLGTLGCFSFNGNKIITTGGGGMVVGNDEKRLDHVKFLINQARDDSRGYFHPEIGFNYRMTNMEAAMGLAQMKRLGSLLARKRRLHDIYVDELSEIEGLFFQEEYDSAESSHWLTCIIIKGRIEVGKLQRRLLRAGMPTRRIFMPITDYPPYMAYKKRDCENARYVYENGLCLPSSTLNSEDDIRRICAVMKKIIKGS